MSAARIRASRHPLDRRGKQGRLWTGDSSAADVDRTMFPMKYCTKDTTTARKRQCHNENFAEVAQSPRASATLARDNCRNG